MRIQNYMLILSRKILNNKKKNKYIDHAILKPETTTEEVRQFYREAKEFGFASVCVNVCNVVFASKKLE